MQSRIVGTTMPVLEVALDPNESIISEAGELSWMTSSIRMTTHTQLGGGGGIFGVLRRIPRLGRLGRSIVCHQGSRPYSARRSRGRTRLHGASAWLSLRDAANSDRSWFPAISRRRHFWRRRIPAAEGQRHRYGMVRAVGRGDHERSSGRRNSACPPGARWRISIWRRLSDQLRARNQEHDLWRRWNIPCRTHRPRKGLAANTAHLQAGSPAHGVHAPAGKGDSSGGRRRRNRRVYS